MLDIESKMKKSGADSPLLKNVVEKLGMEYLNQQLSRMSMKDKKMSE